MVDWRALVWLALWGLLFLSRPESTTASVAGITTDFDALWEKYGDKTRFPTADAFLQLSSMSTRVFAGQGLGMLAAQGDADGGGDTGGGGGGGQPGAGAKLPAGQGTEIDWCAVCDDVIKKKVTKDILCVNQPDPSVKAACDQVLESLMWWVVPQLYWLNYGCEMKEGDKVEWVRPCPSNAVCSWLEHTYTGKQFCPNNPKYPKPTQNTPASGAAAGGADGGGDTGGAGDGDGGAE